MKNWVILFVRTGQEEYLADTLKENLRQEEYLPFLPVKEISRRRRGIITKESKLLFPSYIFVETSIEAEKIAENLAIAITNIAENRDVFQILHYGKNKKDVVMRERERLYWERLLDSNFRIASSVGIIEGDMVKITSGALSGMENRIKRIDRHKREATVEMDMMGTICEVRLMLEVVEKR